MAAQYLFYAQCALDDPVSCPQNYLPIPYDLHSQQRPSKMAQCHNLYLYSGEHRFESWQSHRLTSQILLEFLSTFKHISGWYLEKDNSNLCQIYVYSIIHQIP